MFDFVRHDRAVQQSQVIFQNHGIHGLCHQEPQALATVACGNHAVSVLVEQGQLPGITVDEQHSGVGDHAPVYIGIGFLVLFTIAHDQRTPRNHVG